MTATAESPTRALRGRRVLLWMLGVLVLAVIPAIIVPTMFRRPDPQLDDLGVVPELRLVDETGAPVTRDAFLHHATIVDFVFTRCDTVCPITSLKFQRLQEHLFDVQGRVKLVSISVDPAYDTPEKLAAYAKRYAADPHSWRFFTGDPAEVKRLVEGTFANSMQREPDGPTGAPQIAHSGYFVLVDPAGHIRGYYDSSEVAKLDELMRDARFVSRTMK